MMSEMFTCEAVQYILNDSELTFDQYQDSGSLSDVIYPDGSRAILVNGHFLQGDKDTLIVNEEDLGQVLISDVQTSSNEECDQTKFIQYIDEDCDINPTEGPRIFYIDTEELSDFQFTETSNYSNGSSELFFGKVVNVDSLIELEAEEELAHSQNGFQYAVLRDGQFHIQLYEEQLMPSICAEETLHHEPDVPDSSSSIVKNEKIDFSSITGRNLLTGQKVTLDSYLGKIKRSQSNAEKRKSSIANVSRTKFLLNSLLNKKLKLGRIANGKQLVGKIVQIRHKNEERDEKVIVKDNDIVGLGNEAAHDRLKSVETTKYANIQNSYRPLKHRNGNGSKILFSKKTSKKYLDNISNTLEGLMNMDSVRKKLENKKIVVKVVQSEWVRNTQSIKRNISYISGYMSHKDVEQNMLWTFVSDNDTEKQIKKRDGKSKIACRKKNQKVATLTVILTHSKNGRRLVKVVLNEPESMKCNLCHKEFPSNPQLRDHMNIKHGSITFSQKSLQTPFQNCDIADVEAHLGSETDDENMECNSNQFECYVCSERFPRNNLLQEHLSTHLKNEYYCGDSCDGFPTPADFPHIKSHSSHRYMCRICHRTFSRQSNLHRHAEIHKGVGSMYECDICGCSYHFISSLTRHVVQNHLQR